jgi:histone acetyltransferase 1
MATTANPEEWAVDANDALELSLHSPYDDAQKTFHPSFTYPIFGEAESIYGYKGLKVRLGFASWDMRSWINVSWRQKLTQTIEGVEVDDVADILEEYLPKGTLCEGQTG